MNKFLFDWLHLIIDIVDTLLKLHDFLRQLLIDLIEMCPRIQIYDRLVDFLIALLKRHHAWLSVARYFFELFNLLTDQWPFIHLLHLQNV